MVEVVQRYKSKDGSVWNSLEEAQNREKLIDECNEVESIIGERPKLTSETSKKHAFYDFVHFRHELILLAKRHLGKYWDKAWDVADEKIHPMSVIGRVLDDSPELSPISRLWNRWACIDKQGVEWEQPYYANESNKKLGY